ncbi:MAG: hypothetical protein U5Q44_12785 [Dehalococcoidia bacterium]|nr:hypothetical protein [Dehalococcoidia bacterium]
MTLRTTVQGLFRFLHREAPPAECGEVSGDEDLAAAIQSCFRY